MTKRLFFSFLVAIGLLNPRVSPASVVEKEPLIAFQSHQYYLLPALAAGNLIFLFTGTPGSSRWSGGILFDGAARDALRLSSKDSRDTAAKVGDWLLYSLIAYPTVIDAGLDAGLLQKDSRAAGNIALMNTQAFLITGLASLVFKKLTARERPYVKDCVGDPAYDSGCGSTDQQMSFFSGHAAFSFTAAGLICAHHKSLDLGGGMAPCYVSIAAAVAVGLSRVMADRHYASDVVFGAVVGWLSGFVLTRASNYGSSPATGVVGTGAAIIPDARSRGLGLSLAFGL